MINIADDIALRRRVWIAVTYLLITWLSNGMIGFFDFSEQSYDTYRGLDTGGAITFPLFASVVYFLYFIILRVTSSTLISLSSRVNSPISSCELRYQKFLASKVKQISPVIGICSVLIAFGYLAIKDLVFINELHHFDIAWRLFLLMQAYTFWYYGLKLIVSVALFTRILIVYIQRHVSVMLFQIEKTAPVMKVVMFNLFTPCILIGLQPFNWINASPPKVDIYIIVIALLFTFVLISYPLYSIKSYLHDRKNISIEKININIEKILSLNTKNKRRLVDEKIRLEQVADLLNIRKELKSASEWPIDFPFILKIIVLLILTISGWIANSFIDSFVKSVV